MKKEILLIDDDDIHNFIAKKRLNRIYPEYIVTTRGEPSNALKYLLENDPALILLDLNMREMNGFQFLERYVASGLSDRPTKILMLTSSFFDKDVKEAKKHELIRDYLVKPCDFEVLKAYL